MTSYFVTAVPTPRVSDEQQSCVKSDIEEARGAPVAINIACEAPPPSPLDVDAEVFGLITITEPAEFHSSCAFCGNNVYGVMCVDSNDDGKVLHFGCWSLRRAKHAERNFQDALAHDLQSLQRHLRQGRRRGS